MGRNGNVWLTGQGPDSCKSVDYGAYAHCINTELLLMKKHGELLTDCPGDMFCPVVSVPPHMLFREYRILKVIYLEEKCQSCE